MTMQERNTTIQTSISLWLKCLRDWYPDLQTKTYFLPPLYFSRTSYEECTVSGQKVLVARAPDGAAKQPGSVSPTPHRSLQTSPTRDALSSPHVLDCYVRDDKAQEHVLHCVRALATAQKEAMIVVSQLQFGKYLHKPCYAAAASHFRRPITLPVEYRQGDFDLLIIHSKYGLITAEIKSVGANFTELRMSQHKQEVTVVAKIKEAVKQVNKAGYVLRYLAGVKVTKTLMFPNIKSNQLLRALKLDPRAAKDLCECLNTKDTRTAVRLCLCADQMSCSATPWSIDDQVLSNLRDWWCRLLAVPRSGEKIGIDMYEQLVAKFCGPATTVDIHCVTKPRLEIRTAGEAVSEIGLRMSRLVLFPEQVELLTAPPPLVFIVGPPGTGKTTILVLQGLSWMQNGYDVHVVIIGRQSIAVSYVIEDQLLKNRRSWPTRATGVKPEVVLHKYDFKRRKEDISSAVTTLTRTGQQLHVLVDEAGHEQSQDFLQLFTQLKQASPKVFLWAAAVCSKSIPSEMKLVTMTTPLRTPPVVTREVKKAPQMQIQKTVEGYKLCSYASECDGPAVKRFEHTEGQFGHRGLRPEICEQCGHEVALILAELKVGQTETLRYHDVMVLCDYPNDDQLTGNGHVISRASGLVRGLRASRLPVSVVEHTASDVTIRDMALMTKDEVIVAHWSIVRGLERKVVFATSYRYDVSEYVYDKLHGPSRCLAQLVWIDWHPADNDSTRSSISSDGSESDI